MRYSLIVDGIYEGDFHSYKAAMLAVGEVTAGALYDGECSKCTGFNVRRAPDGEVLYAEAECVTTMGRALPILISRIVKCG